MFGRFRLVLDKHLGVGVVIDCLLSLKRINISSGGSRKMYSTKTLNDSMLEVAKFKA